MLVLCTNIPRGSSSALRILHDDAPKALPTHQATHQATRPVRLSARPTHNIPPSGVEPALPSTTQLSSVSSIDRRRRSYRYDLR